MNLIVEKPMVRYILFLSCIFQIYGSLSAQIDPAKIDIVRDKWGVPHIFAATDREVAYGFGWASCEDDFKTLQDQLLPIRGLAGLVYGKKGAIMDVGVHLLQVEEIVEARYDQDISPDFKAYLDAFCAGVNTYAKLHPKEVLHKKLFPVSGKEVIKAYVVGTALMSGVQRDLNNLLKGKIKTLPKMVGTGSNAFAIRSQKTADGKTYLAINAHQPLEGPNSWYEAHLHSNEGLNIHGATFVGAPVIHLGTNVHLGWAHTLNYPDFADIFQLEMHPEQKLHYKFDGQWEKLEPYFTKAQIKLLGFLKIGAKQKFYRSKYGVTIENEKGFFSLRIPANKDIRAAEQWYRMNKANNFESFMAALQMQAIPCTNIVYADREDTIYYISNGLFPKRAKGYDWKGVVPGNTSKTLWREFYPIDSSAQVLNPPSGYVFNCNNTPFRSSAEADNPNPDLIPKSMGYQEIHLINNRSVRFEALIAEQDKLSYEDFKRIKYDITYHTPLKSAPKLEPIFHLSPEKYPQLAVSLNLLSSWDRVADIDSEGASVFKLVLDYLNKNIKDRFSYLVGDELNEKMLVEALNYAQGHLQQYFGKLEVPLGELQRHRRGEVDLPVGGGRDVLAALTTTNEPDGRMRPRAGDSFIQLVRFSKNGVEIETVNAYGASSKAGSPHYTDQMEMYVKQELKTMTLNKEAILKNATKVYHPK